MPSYIKTVGHLSPTMRSFTVSLIMLCGAIPAIVADHPADRFRRLRIIIVGAILCTIGWVLVCAAFRLWLFLIGRAIMGIGQGFALTNIGIYICKIAPGRSRGESCRCRSSVLQWECAKGTSHVMEVPISMAKCHGVYLTYCRLRSLPFGRSDRYFFPRAHVSWFSTGRERKPWKNLND